MSTEATPNTFFMDDKEIDIREGETIFRAGRRHDMADHGAAGHLVQHLRQVRLHAGALARRQNDAGERAAGFGMMRQCHGACIV